MTTTERNTMKVRCKFKCNSVEGTGDSKTIDLDPVYSGSEENAQFFRWTPGGHIKICCVNEAASREFIEGREYYVDFTLAGDA